MRLWFVLNIQEVVEDLWKKKQQVLHKDNQ